MHFQTQTEFVVNPVGLLNNVAIIGFGNNKILRIFLDNLCSRGLISLSHLLEIILTDKFVAWSMLMSLLCWH